MHLSVASVLFPAAAVSPTPSVPSMFTDAFYMHVCPPTPPVCVCGCRLSVSVCVRCQTLTDHISRSLPTVGRSCRTTRRCCYTRTEWSRTTTPSGMSDTSSRMSPSHRTSLHRPSPRRRHRRLQHPTALQPPRYGSGTPQRTPRRTAGRSESSNVNSRRRASRADLIYFAG